MRELFYYTGMLFWLSVSCVLTVMLWIALRWFWERDMRPSLYNLWFAVSGRHCWKSISYYDKWRRIYEKPALHKHWKRRHNHYSRVAYKRLVREAWKERNKRDNRSKNDDAFSKKFK